MSAFVPAARPEGEEWASLGRDDLLRRYPMFRTDDLDRACEYMSDAVAPHRLSYLGRDHRLDLRHRRAAVGQVVLNALQYGGDIGVEAPDFDDYYLVQFMLEGGCRVIRWVVLTT
jgi:AraC-binding-like domain